MSPAGGAGAARSALGSILIEASVAAVVLSLALVTLVPVFLLTIKANKKAEAAFAAAQLARGLLEEIRLRRWDEASPIPAQRVATPSALGLDAGELSSDKATFDDVDDFAGWSETPPRDPLNAPLGTGFEGFTRSVLVEYLDAALASAAGPTDRKRVQVCAQRSGASQVCLDAVLANR